MSETGKAFGDSVERLLADYDAANQPSSGTDLAWSEKLCLELSTLGLGLLMVDEKQDGAGGTADDLFDVLSVTGRHAATVPSAETIIAGWLASAHGLNILDGVTTIAMADDKIRLSAATDGTVLDGRLEQVAWGRFASHVMFIVDSPEPQLVRVTPQQVVESQSIAGEPRDTLVFENAKADSLCAASLNAKSLLRFTALAQSAQACGAMHAVLEMSMRYVSDREQFGRPLAKFQAIQHHLAVMYSDVVAASTATRGALSLDNPAEAAFESAAAIIRTREAATRVAAIAHQAHGAIGFTADYALGRLTKRLWAWRDEYGDEKWWREELGSLVLSESEKNLWEMLTDASG